MDFSFLFLEIYINYKLDCTITYKLYEEHSSVLVSIDGKQFMAGNIQISFVSGL